MRILKSNDIPIVAKPEGTNVRYFIFDEYEVHYNEQVPGSTQTWHHHEKILETLYIIEGELTAEWKTGDRVEKQIVKKGDLIETEHSPHTFRNHTDSVVRFLVIKQVPSGTSKRDILKTDKIVDEVV
jgi:uncharacterized cupin superfamily protein